MVLLFFIIDRVVLLPSLVKPPVLLNGCGRAVGSTSCFGKKGGSTPPRWVDPPVLLYGSGKTHGAISFFGSMLGSTSLLCGTPIRPNGCRGVGGSASILGKTGGSIPLLG